MYKAIKRAFDILASILGLVVTSPIWIVAIIGIEISDPGPLFYVATRVTKDNKEFKMFKFRSMRAGKVNESVFRGEEDRIFAFGKVIRKLKIDELPQLINILIGNMSVVGPRPAAIDQMDITRSGKYAIAAKAKAGLTCPSAIYDYIHGDSILNEEEYMNDVLPVRLALEPWYIKHMGIGLDIKMIWWTIKAIVMSIFGTSSDKMYEKLVSWANEE